MQQPVNLSLSSHPEPHTSLSPAGNSEFSADKSAMAELASALPAATALSTLGFNSTGMTAGAAKVGMWEEGK